MSHFSLTSSLVSRLAFTLLSGALLSVACSSDDANEPAGAAGQAAGGDVSEPQGGGASEQGGSASEQGGAKADGGQRPSDGGVTSSEGGADSGAAGAASEGAACRVELSMNTSNAIDPDVPLTERCEAITFDGQINFEIYAGEGADQRNLNIDFFADPVMGASVKLEDGYDFQTGMGAAASYMDSVGVWNADSGTVTITEVSGDSYVVTLTDVHFVVLDGPVDVANSGEFTASGTISATAMPATR